MHQIVDRASRYEAADATSSIRIVVTPRARVLSVGISEGWRKKLAPDRFAEALLGAYHSAVQTAFAAEYADGGSAVSERAAHQGPAGLPRPAGNAGAAEAYADWHTGIRSQLQKIRQRLQAIKDYEAEAETGVRDAELRSPNGYFTLQLQGGGLVAITATPSALRTASTELLREDALAVFHAAGLTAEI